MQKRKAIMVVLDSFLLLLFSGLSYTLSVHRAFDNRPSLFQGSSIRTNREFISKYIVINKNSNIPLPEFENVNITNWNKTPDHMANALAPNSGCEPKPVEVPMPLDPDPYVLTWPTCTPVPRCGGCCGNPMLECAPTAVEDKHLKVLKVRYRMGTSRFEYQKFSDVTVQSHTQCSCQCRIKGSDCTYRQYYDEPSCQCKCKAAYKRAGCHSRLKRFDDDTCRCVCHGKITCDSGAGFVFDENLCRCVNQKVLRPGQSGHQRGDSSANPESGVAVTEPPCWMRHHCPPGYRAEAVAGWDMNSPLPCPNSNDGTCTCQIILEQTENKDSRKDERISAQEIVPNTRRPEKVPTPTYSQINSEDATVDAVVSQDYAAPVDSMKFGEPVAPVEFGASDLGPAIIEDPIPVEQFGGTGFAGFPQQPLEEVLGG